MSWNIIWHQAMTKAFWGNLTSPEKKTVVFSFTAFHSGQKLRLRFRNERGKRPMLVGGVTVIVRNHVFPVSLHGRYKFQLPEGIIYSDELVLPLEAGETVEVRIYPLDRAKDINGIQENAGLLHDNALKKTNLTVINRKKNKNANLSYQSIPWLDQIEIFGDAAARNIVAFGDSITCMSYWTEPLQKRLFKNYGEAYSLLNAGLCGNCLAFEWDGIFHDFFGKKGTERKKWDVDQTPDLCAVILALGINDIANMCTRKHPHYNAEALIEETEKLVLDWKEHGIRVIMHTLSPAMGYHNFTREQEKQRQKFNTWIRSCSCFDSIVDVDLILRDPKSPWKLQEGLHRGDHLHPNHEGGARIAAAYDLKKLTVEEEMNGN